MTTLQCEKCGDIFDTTNTTTEQDPDGETIKKGTCPYCGGDAWEVEE